MYYYKIGKSGEKPSKDSHKDSKPQAIINHLDKGRILQSQLSKCELKIGDRVKFRKKSFTGTLVDIEFDVDKVKWGQGGYQPNCMTVKIDKKDKKTGIIYGYDTLYTSPKNLLKINSKHLRVVK